MIGRALSLLSLVFGLTIALAAPVLAQQTNNPPPSSQNPPPPAQACPPGTHWEAAGYVHDGKWRDARCARDDGHE